jgi:hypothetical protein
MSITAFLAFAILGCDFMLYFLFKLLYGEKRSRRRTTRPTTSATFVAQRSRRRTTRPTTSATFVAQRSPQSDSLVSHLPPLATKPAVIAFPRKVNAPSSRLERAAHNRIVTASLSRTRA